MSEEPECISADHNCDVDCADVVEERRCAEDKGDVDCDDVVEGGIAGTQCETEAARETDTGETGGAVKKQVVCAVDLLAVVRAFVLRDFAAKDLSRIDCRRASSLRFCDGNKEQSITKKKRKKP